MADGKVAQWKAARDYWTGIHGPLTKALTEIEGLAADAADHDEINRYGGANDVIAGLVELRSNAKDEIASYDDLLIEWAS